MQRNGAGSGSGKTSLYGPLEVSALIDCAYGVSCLGRGDKPRSLLCCEKGAVFFRLYGIDRDYIIDTFPMVKRKDEAAHSEYRTKRVILEGYYAMTHAIHTGTP